MADDYKTGGCHMRLFTLVIALSISPTVAFAYFDPGTGALIIQAMIGAVAAITVFWGNVKAYARSLFLRGKDNSSDSGSNSDDRADDPIDTE